MRLRLVLLLLLAAPVVTVVARAQQQLPPLSYVCVMPQDADVIEDKPGNCPKCGMPLHAIRLTSIWTCPIHAAVTKEKAGTCPIDGRRLIQVTMAETWTCAGEAQAALEPGTCADGTPRKRTFSARPHGNHNPQHGGQFFMAPDNWHHLEGAYPSAGLFRVYLYDDYTRPLPVAKVRAIAGHVTTADGRDIPLTRRGRTLEASIGKAGFPVVLHAHVKFEPDGKDNLFDFTFPAYSKDAPSAPVTATATAAPATAAPTAAVPPAPMGTPTPTGIQLGLRPDQIPSGLPELLKALQDRSNQIDGYIKQGDLGTVYVPAFEAKDLALSLDDHAKARPEAERQVVDAAVGELVRDTYLLDAYGDLGNERQISAAYQEFAGALKTIEGLYGGEAKTKQP